jgi:hypothetical protein
MMQISEDDAMGNFSSQTTHAGNCQLASFTQIQPQAIPGFHRFSLLDA